MTRSTQLLLSCEHGGNQLPEAYAPLFKDAKDALDSHRGIDKGALPLFHLLEKKLRPHYAIYSETCRLVVDLNRSLHRRTLFSEWTKPLPFDEKQRILNNYYFPYRQSFIDHLKQSIDTGNRALHLSVHSFTPVLNGTVRATDIGILYHPERLWEKEIAAVWKKALQVHLPHLRVRFNYPYLGKPDGHVAYHRKIYDNAQYAGIELELNQKYAFDKAVYEGIVESMVDVCSSQGIALT